MRHPEDPKLHTYCREKLKYRKVFDSFQSRQLHAEEDNLPPGPVRIRC